MLFEEGDRFVIHQRAVLDGMDSGADGALDALGAMGVRGDVEVVILRCFDDRANFFFGELRVLATFRDTEYASGRGDLDQVGAFFVALPHGFLGILHAIDHAFFRPRIAHHVCPDTIGRIGMSAGRGERLARVEDARAVDKSLVDRPLQ